MTDVSRQGFRLIHRLRVRWAEVDLQRIVFNPHYLMYIDTAFTEYWRAMAIPYELIPQALGGDLYVKKSTLEYHGSARLDDLLDIGVQCARIGNSSMIFRAGIFRNEALLVSGEMVYVFADPATQTSKPVPDESRGLLQSYEAGVSPQVDIIAEEDQQIFFNQSLATVLTQEWVDRMEDLCDRLGLHKRERYDWRKEVKSLVEVTRANGFGPEQLAGSKTRSIESFQPFLGEPLNRTEEQWNQRLEELL